MFLSVVIRFLLLLHKANADLLISSEQAIVKSTFVGNYTLPANYKLGFSLKATNTSNVWTNVFHFTSDGSNCCSSGSRSPALWVPPNSQRLNFVIGTVTDGNWGFEVPIDIGINCTVAVELLAVGQRAQVLYNGTFAYDTLIPGPRYSGATQAYVSDKYYPAAFAKINSLSLQPIQSLLKKSLDDEHSLSVAWFFDQIFVPTDYSLSFTIKPTGSSSQNGNVVHFGVDGQGSASRIPAIFIPANTLSLQFRVSTVVDPYWSFSVQKVLPLNQSTRVKMIAYKNQIQILYNETQVYLTSCNSRIYGVANAYFSNPWNPAALATIKNVSLIELSPSLQRVQLIVRENSQSSQYFKNVLNFDNRFQYDTLVVGPSFSGNFTSILHDANGLPKYSALLFADGELGYQVNDTWQSALNETHWTQIEEYETAFSVPRLMFDTWPEPIKNGAEFSSPSSESTLIHAASGLQFNGTGLYVPKSVLSNSSGISAEPLFYADSNSSIAAVQTHLRGSSQLVFFFPCADWSDTCYSISQVWAPWLVHGYSKDSLSCVEKSTGLPLKSIGNTRGEIVLSCSLLRIPSEDVFVSFISTNLLFSNGLLFSANSNTSVEVGLQVSQSSLANYSANILFVSRDVYFGKKTMQLSVLADPWISSSTFYLQGDPHFLGLNSAYYDFQQIGTYTILKGLGLLVQASFYRCNPYNSAVSCANAVAVQYGDSALIYNCAFKNASSSIRPKSLGDPALRGMTWSTISSTIYIKLEDGTSIRIYVYGPRLDFTIDPSPRYYQKISGQANYWDKSVTGNVLQLPNGTFVQNSGSSSVDEWGKLWLVPDDKSLLNARIASIPVDYYKTGFSLAPVTETYSKCDYTNTNCGILYKRSEIVDLNISCPMTFNADANLKCTQSIQSATSCVQLMPELAAIQIQACTKDSIGMCSLVFVEDYKQTFMAECLVNAAKALETSRGILAEAILNQNYSCGTTGTPSATGCKCNSGYSGADCSVSLKSSEPLKLVTFVDNQGAPVVKSAGFKIGASLLLSLLKLVFF